MTEKFNSYVLYQSFGPISVSHYMRLCLNHPAFGYYTSDNVFGKKGDFITAPEINQIFGEIIAAYFWNSASRYHKFRYIELGPGKGTLLSDILRSWDKFGSIRQSLASCHLVEQSQFLRKEQADSVQRALDISSKSVKKHNDRMVFSDWLSIFWHDNFEEIGAGYPPYIMANEFFDAIPVEQFKKTDSGWHEVMVDVDLATGDFRFVLSKNPRSGIAELLRQSLDINTEKFTEGDILEFSPDTLSIISKITQFIAEHQSGEALIADYTSNNVPRRTLRAIKSHKFVDPLFDPGNCDLTADVNFRAITHFVRKSFKDDGIAVSEPIGQGDFLRRLGSDIRMKAIAKNLEGERKSEFESSYEKLVNSEQMGATYQLISLKSGKIAYPFDMIYSGAK